MLIQQRSWLFCLLTGFAGLVACDRSIDPTLVAESVVQITTPLSGTLSVQDANGRSRSSFSRSENVYLVFRLRNTGDTSILTGPRPIFNPPDNFYLNLVYDQNFFSLVRITGESPVGEYIGKPFATYGHPDYVNGPILVPPRTTAEWRVPWRDTLGTTYRLPVFTPATSLGIQRPYGRYEPDPGPLVPGFYRSGFTLDVDDRRAAFSITFRVE